MDNSISSFKTEKGSVYLHLENGRIQRFKAATRKLSEPRDLTVFLPNYEFVKNGAPKKQLQKLGRNEREYMKVLSSSVYGRGNKIHIVDEDGNQIEENQILVKTKKRTFFRFVKDNKAQFYLPVSENPKIGMTPYESTLKEENGEWYRTKHLGHKVIEIEKNKLNSNIVGNILNKLK
ncbi:hypothetical protein HNV12_01455 [Methanococcoides sp. SA1]|nr:hypothetical protein [Methanococcoides sp. SA1]